ncbi:DNA-binding protein [Solitalea longa]|uniref:DNA-binding protein n=1 Tax=Solitalea longa TaxID=2079460 RepID=A0A2S4ZY06_9SPHI|nr:ORF6N domain-containing protein [Solitalea longa]POY35230.1 DNA-binding protein [Solitalea longa]
MEHLLIEENIASKIYFFRGYKVMLDSDLAGLYGVTTKRLNEQVKRNLFRFPADFMFQLTEEEYEEYLLRSQFATLKTAPLRSQFVTSSSGRGKHRKYLPYVFTEHGAVMLASVLNSPVAIEASILVVRAFVRLRNLLESNKELTQKLLELERSTKDRFDEQSSQIDRLFKALKQLINRPGEPRKQIGYKPEG